MTTHDAAGPADPAVDLRAEIRALISELAEKASRMGSTSRATEHRHDRSATGREFREPSAEERAAFEAKKREQLGRFREAFGAELQRQQASSDTTTTDK